MDELKQGAQAFNNLLDIEYHIILGRKGKTVKFTLCFDSCEFYHLAGLQYLKDMPNLKISRHKVYNDILNGHLKYNTLSRSAYFDGIKDRLCSLYQLESILDDNKTVYRLNTKALPFNTAISAEYLLSHDCNSQIFYIFIDQIQDTGKHYCRSFFPKGNADYTQNQPCYKLLYKSKTNIRTGGKVVLFDKLTPLHKE